MKFSSCIRINAFGWSYKVLSYPFTDILHTSSLRHGMC